MQDDHRDSGAFNGDYNSIVRVATLSNSCGFTAAGLKGSDSGYFIYAISKWNRI